jgi:hypothetical protein
MHLVHSYICISIFDSNGGLIRVILLKCAVYEKTLSSTLHNISKFIYGISCLE